MRLGSVWEYRPAHAAGNRFLRSFRQLPERTLHNREWVCCKAQVCVDSLCVSLVLDFYKARMQLGHNRSQFFLWFDTAGWHPASKVCHLSPKILLENRFCLRVDGGRKQGETEMANADLQYLEMIVKMKVFFPVCLLLACVLSAVCCLPLLETF